MKNRIIGLTVLTVLVLTVGCQKPNKSIILKQIEELDQREETHTPVDRAKLHQLFERYAKAFPDDSLSPGFLFNAAHFQLQVNELEHATELTSLFLSRYPMHEESRWVHLTAGQAFYKLDKADSAVKQFEAARKMEPLENSHKLMLGKSFERAAELDTTKRSSAYLLDASNMYTETGYYEKADTMLRKICYEYPNSKEAPSAYMRLVQLKELNGELEEGRKLLRELIAKYPESNFANDASTMLEKDLLGKTPEEIFQIITQTSGK